MTVHNRKTHKSGTRGILAVILLLTACPLSTAQEIVDSWRYTLRRPARGWQRILFDDSAWKRGSP